MVRAETFQSRVSTMSNNTLIEKQLDGSIVLCLLATAPEGLRGIPDHLGVKVDRKRGLSLEL